MRRRDPPSPHRARRRRPLALLVSRSLRRMGAVLLGIVAMACFLAAWHAATAAWDVLTATGEGSSTPAVVGLLAIGAVLSVCGARLMSWCAAIDLRLRNPEA